MGLLEVRDLTVRFGGVVALDRVTFTVDAGRMVAVIGPNGAGKTTLFNIITRVYRPASGAVLVDGKPVRRISSSGTAWRARSRTSRSSGR